MEAETKHKGWLFISRHESNSCICLANTADAGETQVVTPYTQEGTSSILFLQFVNTLELQKKDGSAGACLASARYGQQEQRCRICLQVPVRYDH